MTTTAQIWEARRAGKAAPLPDRPNSAAAIYAARREMNHAERRGMTIERAAAEAVYGLRRERR